MLCFAALLLLGILVLAASSAAAAPAAPASPTIAAGTWAVYTPTGLTVHTPLYAVAAAGPNDVWAAGAAGGVYHFNGTAWSAIPGAPAVDLFGVSLVPGQPNTAVVTGSDELPAGTKPSVVLTCTLTTCTRDMTVPNMGSLDTISAVSPTEYWLAGGGQSPASGTILHLKNGVWTGGAVPVTGTIPSVQYHYLQMLNADEGYMVGESATTGGPGTLLHYTTATGWQPVNTGLPFTGPLHGVWFISPQEGWAVGGNLGSTPVILHYLATATPQWSLEGTAALPVPETQLWAVYMNPDRSGYAAGNDGQILYRTSTGTTWQSVFTDPTQQPLFGVWTTGGGTEGWAVGGGAAAVFDRMAPTIHQVWLPIVMR